MSEKKTVRVNLNVMEELYAEYKIALLKRYPRRNVTQDLTAHMREVIKETQELNEKK